MYVCILRVDLNKFDISKTQVKFCLLEKLQALQKNIIKNARKSTQRCTSQTCKTCQTFKTACTANSACVAHSARTADTALSARTAHISRTAHTAHPEISHTLTP